MNVFPDEGQRRSPRGVPSHLAFLQLEPPRRLRVLVARVRAAEVVARRASFAEDVEWVFAVSSVEPAGSVMSSFVSTFVSTLLRRVRPRGAQQHPRASRAHVPEPPVHAR